VSILGELVGVIELQDERDEVAAHGVVDLEHGPLALGRDRRRLRPLGCLLVQARVGDRDSGMGGEALQQFGVLVAEATFLVVGEHDERADELAPQLDGHGQDGVLVARVSGGPVTVRHLRVVVEQDGGAGPGDGAGDALVQGEDLTGGTVGGEVDLFAVRALHLVDEA